MRFINPSYEILKETDPFNMIELAGRTCYQSEPKEGDTPQKFFGRLVDRKHYAMTEFTNFVFTLLSDSLYEQCEKQSFLRTSFCMEKGENAIVSGNLRALNECQCGQLLLTALIKKHPEFAELLYNKPVVEFTDREIASVIYMEPAEYNEKLQLPALHQKQKHLTMTVRVVTNRGVTHEIVRNRPFSFAQESTRYVKYGKNGDPMQFILPTWVQGDEREALLNFDGEYFEEYLHELHNSNVISAPVFTMASAFTESETYYGELLNHGWQPQQAREVLPNGVKTEIVICGNLEQWRHFFFLRCDKFAHLEMRAWTIPLYNELREQSPQLWGDIADRIDLSV
jgi:thymidylate synthase (FAD)